MDSEISGLPSNEATKKLEVIKHPARVAKILFHTLATTFPFGILDRDLTPLTRPLTPESLPTTSLAVDDLCNSAQVVDEELDLLGDALSLITLEEPVPLVMTGTPPQVIFDLKTLHDRRVVAEARRVGDATVNTGKAEVSDQKPKQAVPFNDLVQNHTRRTAYVLGRFIQDPLKNEAILRIKGMGEIFGRDFNTFEEVAANTPFATNLVKSVTRGFAGMQQELSNLRHAAKLFASGNEPSEQTVRKISAEGSKGFINYLHTLNSPQK